MLRKPSKISLNLGGGGARGLAHLGVLKALEEHDIEFDILIGVSMGALIAANYAYYKNIADTENLIIEHIESDTFKHSLLGTWRSPNLSKLPESRGKRFFSKFSKFYKQTELYSRLLLSRGILDEEDIAESVLPIIPNVDFSDLQKPFACVAVNIETGVRNLFTSGSVQQAVLASLSMPLVFPPVEIEGSLYTDGGVVDRIGVDAAFDLGVTKIIAVDVSNEFFSQKRLKTGLDIMLRSEEISAIYRKNYQLEHAEIVIKPIEESIHWADYHNYRNIIDSGYQSTLERISDLKKAVKQKKSVFRVFLR
jgi:NTE family protein